MPSSNGTALDATLNGILKEVFATEVIEEVHRKKSALWAWMPKKSVVGNPELPLEAANSPGFSSDINRADANANYSEVLRYQLKMGDYFGAVRLTHKDMSGVKGEAALVDLVTNEVKRVMSPATQHLCYQLQGTGTGVLGTVSAVSGAGPYVITLSNSHEASRFMKNQKLAVTSSIGTKRGAAGDFTVTVVNPVTNQITITDEASGGASIVATDLVYGDGDDASGNIFPGLKGWIDGTGGTWYGVDTSFNPTHARGIFKDYSSYTSLYEALTDICADYSVYGNGHATDATMFMHSRQWAKLQKELQSNQHGFQRLPAKETVVGHKAFLLTLDAVELTVYVDNFLDITDCFILDKSSICLYHLNESPLTFIDMNEAGSKWDRDLNVFKAHMAGYNCLGIAAGNRQMRAVLPAL